MSDTAGSAAMNAALVADGNTRRPNVLLVMCDELKATALGLYGNPTLRTPSLERLARQGILYRHAFTNHPLCVPARVAMWTGRYPHATGARTNQTFLPPVLPPGVRHMAQCWWDAGYTTALVGKNHCFLPDGEQRFGVLGDGWGQLPGRPVDPGVAAARAWRPPRPDASPTDCWAAPYAPEHSGTWQVTDRAVEFVEEQASVAARSRPWALWVSYNDPHPPFHAPEAYARRFPPETVDLPPWRDGELDDKPQRYRAFAAMTGVRGCSELDLRRLIGIYYAMTAQVDDCVGRLLDSLERTGQRENTIVVFTADHGDLVGEHAMAEKGGLLCDALVRVPLLLAWPGHLPAGLVVEDALASLVDLMPTLLWLQGLPIPPGAQGQPLAGVPVDRFGLPRMEPATAALDALVARGFRPQQRPGRTPEETAMPVSFASPAWLAPDVLQRGRQVAFAEYAAGGPPVTVEDVRRHPPPPGRRPVLTLLLEREAEGRPKMARTHRWKYIYDPLDPHGVDELYDLEADPWELTNLSTSANPEHQAAKLDLLRQLLAWSIRTEDAAPVPFAFPPR
jgi:arylsulfatase A-like enzyme